MIADPSSITIWPRSGRARAISAKKRCFSRAEARQSVSTTRLCRLLGMSVKVDSRKIIHRQTRYVVLLDLVAKLSHRGPRTSVRRRDRLRPEPLVEELAVADRQGLRHRTCFDRDRRNEPRQKVRLHTTALPERASCSVTLDLGRADDDRLGNIV